MQYTDSTESKSKNDFISNLKKTVDNVENIVIALTKIKNHLNDIEDELSAQDIKYLDKLLSNIDTYAWAVSENRKRIFAELEKVGA